MSFRTPQKLARASIGVFVCLTLLIACGSELLADSGTVAGAVNGYQAMSPNDRARFLQEIGVIPAKLKPSAPTKRAAKDKTGTAAPITSATIVPGAPQRPLVVEPTLSKRNAATDNVYGGCQGFVPLLRQDWTDIDFATCPQTVDKATGAQISYSDDQVKKNTSWTVDGTAALLYNFSAGNLEMSTGAYVTVDRTTNSAVSAASSNVDKLAYGGVFEFGTSTSNDPYSANYFRIRGGGVEDHLMQTTSSNVTFEWLPVYEDHSFIHIQSPFTPIPGVPFILRFDPVLLIQYASIVGGTKPLAFNNLDQALRIGPQLTLTMYSGTDDFWSHFTGHVTYHEAYETYSGRELSWLQTSLTYNLDKAGHLGLTGSYQRGPDEDTGVFSKIYKLSLTAKI
jgi:hypothetical protein